MRSRPPVRSVCRLLPPHGDCAAPRAEGPPEDRLLPCRPSFLGTRDRGQHPSQGPCAGTARVTARRDGRCRPPHQTVTRSKIRQQSHLMVARATLSDLSSGRPRARAGLLSTEDARRSAGDSDPPPAADGLLRARGASGALWSACPLPALPSVHAMILTSELGSKVEPGFPAGTVRKDVETHVRRRNSHSESLTELVHRHPRSHGTTLRRQVHKCDTWRFKRRQA